MNLKDTYVFSDVDGTLLVEGKKVPKRNREAIARFVDLGGHFGLCTDRWVEGVEDLAKELGVNTYSVIGNGSGIYDHEAGKVVYYQSLPEDAHEIYENLVGENKKYGFIGVSMKEGYHHLGKKKANLKAFDSLDYSLYKKPLDDRYLKITIALPKSEKASAVVNHLNEEYGSFLDRVRFVETDDGLIDILPRKANKGAGIRKVCDLLGISSDQVVFVGDHFSDYEAFAIAGISACMEDTPPALRIIPTYALGKAKDGAVADLLNMLIRKSREGDCLETKSTEEAQAE